MIETAVVVAWLALGLLPMVCCRNMVLAVVLPAVILVAPIFAISYRMQKDGEYLCLGGRLAKTYGERVHLIYRDGTLVPCAAPTTRCSGECPEMRGLYPPTHYI